MIMNSTLIYMQPGNIHSLQSAVKKVKIDFETVSCLATVWISDDFTYLLDGGFLQHSVTFYMPIDSFVTAAMWSIYRQLKFICYCMYTCISTGCICY